MKTSVIELLQTEFAPNPDFRSSAVNRCDITYLNTIARAECLFPIRVEHYGFVPDTGGAGQYRGGLAVRRDVRFLGRRAVLQIRSDRAVVTPWGLAGGAAGTTSKNLLFARDGTCRPLPSKIVTEIESGAMWRHITASGGGWGDPARRSSAAIEQDLQDGKVTEAGMAEAYGRQLSEVE